LSATQPVKFIDMIWAATLGWLVFSDVPAATTFAGAAIIFAATTWIARREARQR
jgi:drug/metabolite transporter (DMT)-like permease